MPKSTRKSPTRPGEVFTSVAITLFNERDEPTNIGPVVSVLNQICHTIDFHVGSPSPTVPGPMVHWPDSHRAVAKQVRAQSATDVLTVVFTSKPYDNNFFFEGTESLSIVSFYAWESLTNLPRTNGVVYFVADLLALMLSDSFRHEDTTGCIFDFLWDKTGIDTGMRFAGVCQSCLRRLPQLKLDAQQRGILSDLKALLDALGLASKWGNDIATYPLSDSAMQSRVDIKLPSPNVSKLEVLRRQLGIAGSASSEKGRMFEDFCAFFFGSIRGWREIARDVRLEDCEVDLVYDISDGPSLLTSRMGHNIYVECRNRTEKAGASDISHFIQNLTSRNLKAGMFFSYSGIAGYDPGNWQKASAAYRRIIDEYKQRGTFVLPMVAADIDVVMNRGDLVEHLRELLNRFSMV